ncbi:ABC transporter permease [Runella sp.]|uniref:ABC transporter permease n=1 Tax=Runella sp. TaxID=1960881 RepID=UPI003D0DC1FA
MLRNYLKIAWRNLVKNKTFSLINILGLALGMACSLLIMLWVYDELSIDAFHANKERVYSIYERQYHDGKINTHFSTPGLLADEIKRKIPEVEYACGADWGNRNTFQAGDKINKMEGTWAGADFFKMFSYPILQGTAATALKTPNDIAISRNMAEQFYGSPEKALGQAIRFDNKNDFKIAAVFENVPANSSAKFDWVLNWAEYVKQNEWVKDWGNNSPDTYIQLRVDADAAKVAAKLERFLDLYNKYQNKAFYIRLGIMNYSDTYLRGNFKEGKPDGGRIEYVKLFSIVAVIILLIACINFMNLTTARSAKRAKEVGIRKVVGAMKSALIGQFSGEALLLTFFSILAAILLVTLLLPSFNSLTNKTMILPLNQPVFWLALVGLLLVTGLVAGSYPALFLSSLQPIRVLKGALKFSSGATYFRQGLVVFQFALSIMLIVSMIVIYRQVDFVQSKNLGYDRENLIYVPLEGDLLKNYSTFKEEMLKTGHIKEISKMTQAPTRIGNTTGGVDWPGKDPNVNIQFAFTQVGYDFIKTLQLKLREGRDFSKAFATDSVGYIINEAALKRIGYKNPIDQPLTMWGKKGKIIGVLKDFHFQSLHSAIIPMIARLDENIDYGSILIRTHAGKTKESLASLEKISKELNPKFPFTYQFSDDDYAKLYKSEQVVTQLANYFAILAIFISCLGLFGLATFTAEQRTKEIGVRKVLGASVAGITTLLSMDFIKPVLIATLIAFPVAWYFLKNWLEKYAYQIDLEWWYFASAAVAAIAIALLTVSYQAIRAALMNPVKSLKAE